MCRNKQRIAYGMASEQEMKMDNAVFCNGGVGWKKTKNNLWESCLTVWSVASQTSVIFRFGRVAIIIFWGKMADLFMFFGIRTRSQRLDKKKFRKAAWRFTNGEYPRVGADGYAEYLKKGCLVERCHTQNMMIFLNRASPNNSPSPHKLRCKDKHGTKKSLFPFRCFKVNISLLQSSFRGYKFYFVHSKLVHFVASKK